MECKACTSCVLSCLIYGSETWLMKAEHEVKLDLRRVCGFTLSGRNKNAELRELLGLEPVSLLVKKDRLTWGGDRPKVIIP